MVKFKYLALVILALISDIALAATDIGLGTLKGVKVYDLGSDKSIRVYFNDDVILENVSCNKTAILTNSAHDKEFTDRFLSVALAAYMSGKKVRIVSYTNDCEASFIGFQETYF